MLREMTPINGLSKAKRLAWFGPQNLVSYTYMKRLREHDDTRRVFACDPYVEVYQFRDNLYGLWAPNCDGAGDVWQWLTIGPQKCLLIDTAYGLGDTKALVEMLAPGKEIIVVNTHDHFDHAFGNCRFERVYCHEALVPLLETQNSHMWDYLWDKKTMQNKWLAFDKKDLPSFHPYEIIGVPNGYTWDLGDGYEIELINSNGHGGAGAAMYLDKRNKILFPGDNICADISGCGNVSYPLEDCSLYKYRECVRKLVERMDEIDWVFPMHFMCDLENRILPAVLEALDDVLSDPKHNYDYKIEQRRSEKLPPRVRYCKYIKGFSILCYSIVKSADELTPSAIAALTK